MNSLVKMQANAVMYAGTPADFVGVAGGGNEQAVIFNGAIGSTVDKNVDRVDFQGSSADYSFKAAAGSLLVIDKASGEVVANIAVDSEDGQLLAFTDGAVQATNTDNVVSLGEQVIESTESDLTAPVDGEVKSALTSTGSDTPADPDQPAGPADLTEAVQALADAKAAEAAYLEGLGKIDEDFDTLTESVAATATAVEGMFNLSWQENAGDTYQSVNDLTGTAGDIDPERDDAYNEQIIKAQQDDLQKVIDNAQKEVDKLEGLTEAVAALQSAQTGMAAADEAQKATATEMNASLGAFKGANAAKNDAALQYNAANVADGTALAPTFVLVSGTNAGSVIVVDANGNIVIADAAKNDAKAAELLVAVQNDIAAMQEVASAVEAMQEAVGEVLTAEGFVAPAWDGSTGAKYEDSTDPGVAANALYKDPEGNLYAAYDNSGTVNFYPAELMGVLNGSGSYTSVTVTYDSSATTGVLTGTYDSSQSQTIAVAATVAGVALATPYTPSASEIDTSAYVDPTDAGMGGGSYLTAQFATDADVSDAFIKALAAKETFDEAVKNYEAAKVVYDELAVKQQAIKDAEAAFEELGVKLVKDGSFTAEDDVAVLDESVVTLKNFGKDGFDQYFVGDGYTRTDVANDVDVEAKEVGESSLLEIFFQQQGSNLVLYLEKEPFSGNAAGADNYIEITLTGVKSEAVTFADGFLSAGEASA